MTSDLPPSPPPTADDDDGGRPTTASGPMTWLRESAGAVLAVALAALLVLPVVAWGVDTLLFQRRGAGVAEAVPALADAVALVNRRGCDGAAGSGSGFAITHEGRPAVVTNRHVVGAAAAVGVRTLDGAAGPDVVEVLLAPSEDVAVLVLDEPIGDALAFGRPPAVGDEVRLVGFPGARPITSAGAVAAGDDRRVVLDLPADPGASGAPLVDDDGRVVAQVVARTPEGDGVAIPIDRVAAALRDVVPAPSC